MTTAVLNKNLTWDRSKQLCESQGKKLCTTAEACPDGKTLNGGVIAGVDGWAPVGDMPNEWIQVGNLVHAPCTKHSVLGSPPLWGTDGSYENTYLKCCGGSTASQPQPMADQKKTETRAWGLSIGIIILLVICSLIILSIVAYFAIPPLFLYFAGKASSSLIKKNFEVIGNNIKNTTSRITDGLKSASSAFNSLNS